MDIFSYYHVYEINTNSIKIRGVCSQLKFSSINKLTFIDAYFIIEKIKSMKISKSLNN